jgi:hypothetical protein
MKKYLPHALAKLFPRMDAATFKELVIDIKHNGLLQPIMLYQERVLDGVHRQDACAEADVTPRYDKFFGEDPIGYVLSVNLKRRHLSESQRAMIAAKIAALPKGSHGGQSTHEGTTRKQAGRLLKVSIDSIKRAKTVQKQGTPELFLSARHVLALGELVILFRRLEKTSSEKSEVLALGIKHRKSKNARRSKGRRPTK